MTHDPSKPLRILCADDNEMLGEMLLCLFARAGHWVEHAVNGLDAWKRFSNGTGNYDVVLTDHQMPGLTGLGLVELLRQVNFSGRIIVHTSGLPPTDFEGYRSFGVMRFIIKSARADELLDAVAAA